MKCYKCGGTGVYDIYNDCPVCDGTGEYDPTDKGFGLPHDDVKLEKKWENTVWDTDAYLDDLDGKEPQTNEEWFDGLSTEEKAEWLSKHLHCGDCDIENRTCAGTYNGCKETLIGWLKAVHKE